MFTVTDQYVTCIGKTNKTLSEINLNIISTYFQLSIPCHYQCVEHFKSSKYLVSNKTEIQNMKSYT